MSVASTSAVILAKVEHHTINAVKVTGVASSAAYKEFTSTYSAERARLKALRASPVTSLRIDGKLVAVA